MFNVRVCSLLCLRFNIVSIGKTSIRIKKTTSPSLCLWQHAAEKAETGFLTSTLSLLLPPPSLCITIYRSYRNNTRHYQFHLARSHKQAITLLTVQFPARVHPEPSNETLLTTLRLPVNEAI